MLGNNLVRLLVSRGVHAKALVRSRDKAEKQLAGFPVEIVVGEMRNVGGFAEQFKGIDVIFQTAAYFRDNYKGGSHGKELLATNVAGTAQLIAQAYHAGVRRIVHTSSVPSSDTIRWYQPKGWLRTRARMKNPCLRQGSAPNHRWSAGTRGSGRGGQGGRQPGPGWRGRSREVSRADA